MLVSDFDYDLPEHLIAQEPSARRDSSRLLVVDRSSGKLFDSVFTALSDNLRDGDLLVLNNTRVFPARLIGRRLRVTPRGDTILGGRVEVFLVSRIQPLVWETLVRPGRSVLPGARVEFARGKLTAEVLEWRERGRRVVRFEAAGNFDEIIDRIGRTPLPPYIKRDEEDRLDAERYQTVFARERGAVAAPTAGLHFTPELLNRLRSGGIEIAEITLHVGYGTFQPVRVERVEDHRVEPETYSISEEAAASINRALSDGRRVIAVGTTTTRALESAARQEADEQRGGGAEEQRSGGAEGLGGASTDESSPPHAFSPPLLRSSSPPPLRSSAALAPRTSARIAPGTATTDLFIYPGFEFRVVNGLVTNFHLPCSSLLMLVSAFAGREIVLEAYRHAVEHEYRFYSYGDAMLIL
ncbi:MAG TPA: tRNA preQ1(34) S-adenosylmethionine ribosyltransferase-isomerase QueA [Blastocatellia bacterium]|nr:tRNA preQ1(34) S-adenosylmethionine ribosyltransferase-isomerase QueA [Blastocatellia bacterium]